ncbi:phosphotriesterase family protein [Demequina subtropica]|uniref:phosphotriesterase family protein n=1 Tax=Demequina subtropica TaxID=1638989 RepID=UPI001E309356|nr:phosphotriesterase-related protein [Demequina subtropica]
MPTVMGVVPGETLGTTLMHEHLFVLDPGLDRDLPHPEWDDERAVAEAVALLTRLASLGIGTVVDLTVPGLGRDVARVQRVAALVPVRIVVATGWYTATSLPPYFGTHGPGRLVGGPDPLERLMVQDLETGIAGTGVRAGVIKLVSDSPGMTADVARVFAAGAAAHRRTGAPVMTHSDAASRGGLEQQDVLAAAGVDLERVVIGHCGDSQDLDYLMRIADRGSSLGFDRFGMAHTQSDEARIATLLALLERGYAGRIVLSHDAAVFSRVTPPSWRARAAPHWRMDHLSTTVLPALRAAGIPQSTLDTIMIDNPRHLLEGP